ncbi:MAG: XRE family transcriptional regulator [Eubacterium ventriosum]|nr:XRE family transcriptional regulator [Eubacterium ventriosum]
MCYILEIKEMFEMDSNKTPSEIIAELCVEAGISKSELARRLEITPSQITRILNGDTKTISSDILIKLTKLFGVSADYLLGITDKKEIIKEKHTTRVPMLLMSSAFPLGRCIEFIESIDDVPQKEMAYAEYYYFSGRHEKAVEYAEMYLNCEDIMLKLSASLIYTFANLSLDRIHSARFGLERLKEYLKEAMLEETDKKTRTCCVFVATAAHTLLHIPVGDLPPLAEYLSEFTKGMQLWGAYVLAHKAYLVKDYQRSLGIVQTCLMTCSKVYPIAMIYLNLVVAMDLMNLKETDKAKVYFMKVWEISRPDNLIEGIGEHHGLLQGLIEACMKKDYPEDYARIIDITYKFSAGWRRIHNPDTNEDVADNN